MEMIPDFMWKEIKGIIINKKNKTGRPPFDPAKVLNGIFFVLRTGAQWKNIPKEYGKKSTIHGWFIKWSRNGTFKKIMDQAKACYCENLNQPIAWVATDVSSCKAPYASQWSGRNPTDRGKLGAKKSIIVDLKGAPLAVEVGPANKHDSKFFKNTFANLEKMNFKVPLIIAADSAYDNQELKQYCMNNEAILLAATNVRRNKNKKRYQPSFRWIVERSFGWLAWFRGLKTCWTKSQDAFKALLQLASSVQLFKMVGEEK